MSIRSREAKVFAALLASMTTGAVLLMALGNNPPSAGAFCLDTYNGLDPIGKAIASEAAQRRSRWNRIEVYCSGTEAGNIEQLASLSGLGEPQDINCHFVVCNGLGGDDGQIQPSEKWQRQWSLVPGRTWHGDKRTIRICVVSNSKVAPPTDFQVKRVEELVEALSRKFDIQPESIRYPCDWR
jgi:hypothetical protein